MPQQQIIWTTLPSGRRGNGASETLMLSVVASPRLRLDDGGTGLLQSFPDFLDWPAHVQQTLTGFDLFIDDDETHRVDPVAATIVSAQPGGSDVWKALFSATTSVRSQQFQGLQEPVASYSVSGVAAQLQAGYTRLAHDAPFRPADKDTFKQSFPTLAGGPSPIVTASASPMRARLSQLPTLPTEQLASMHRELSVALLHAEHEMSFDEKLAAVTRVAGSLARAAPLGHTVPLVAETDHPAGELAKLVAFHRRAATPSPLDGVTPPPQPNHEIDFHRALTALGEYSWLLRQLRLVLDLEIDVSRVPKSSIGALRHLRARPRFSSPVTDASTYTPVTKYILDNDATGPLPFPVFVAAPKAAQTPPHIQTQLEIVGGFLNLGLTRPPPPPTDDLQFDVFTVDIDGAAKKLLNTIQMVAGDGQAAPIDAATEIAAPALQTSGLNLVRTGQADLLTSDVKTAGERDAARQAGQRAVLFAEDLVRGYRIDICHFPPGATLGQPWMSLHQRTGNLRFKRDGASDITIALPNGDEGFVQPVLVQYPNGGGTNPIYIHESYAHWQGWSLSAPLPADAVGLTRGQTDVPAAPAGLKQVESTVQAASGTLPRLRFGHSYQMRVRTVDLAGNGLNLERAQSVLDALFNQRRPEVFLPISGQQLPYRRFDPIASPVLVLREELMEGEAADVMVIRSNGAPTTTASYAASLGDPRYHGFNDRHVAPPKSSQRMAERHGRLDAAFGIAGRPQSVFGVFARDLGTLNDVSVINIQTGQAESLPDVVRTDATGAQTTIPHGLRFFATDQAKSDRSGYTVHYEEQLRLPYLPDPLADGAALFGLPGVKKIESLVLVESSTPGTVGTLVSLREGPNTHQLLEASALDQLGAITKIGFPSAAQWPDLRCFRLRLDGGLDPNGETPTWSEVNGVRTLTVRLAPAEVSTIFISTYPRPEDVALFALHFSWSRLGAPEGERQFIGQAQHGALAMLTPAHKVVLVHAVQQPLIAPQVAGTPFAVKRFPGDTVAYLTGRFKIHGKSTEKLDLLASWTEPLQESEGTRSIETHVLEVPISLGDPDPLGTHGDPVPIATYTKAPTDSFEFNAPPRESDARAKSFLARHEFGDTRHRRVTYRLVAATRFKEHFPARITSDTANITRTFTFENAEVLNSVRPPALEVTSIIPAFQWDRSLDLTSSKRAGGWLRVYLGSKWFATGEGEMVAVVGEAAGRDPASGADPLHATPSSSQTSTIIPTVPPVVFPGQPNIYPFEAHHDDEIGRWYADVAFNVSTLYFPFVRLRLARFQKQSLDGLQLSPVVEVGFYQLAPDRAVALTFIDVVEGQPDKRKIDIMVSGPRAAAAGLTTGAHLSYSVEAGVEERALGAPGDPRDPNLGWVPSTTIVPIVASGQLDAGVLWHGAVILPAFADMDRRIVIKEFEIFPPGETPPGQAWSGEPAGGPSRRLVYADTIPVR
jgi:hypothetical protein